MDEQSPGTNGNGKWKFLERVLTSQGPAAVIALSCVGAGLVMLLGMVETPWAGLKDHIASTTRILTELVEKEDKSLGLQWATCHNAAKDREDHQRCDKFWLPFSGSH